MTKEQLHVLQHSLGLDEYGQGKMYRNHFCAGGEDEQKCRALVEMGYMHQHATTQMLPYFNCSVTEAGKEAVKRESPKPPKLTRGQKRYREFLNADSGLSFIEWLRGQREYSARWEQQGRRSA
jgi:hypothetical protein